MPSLFYRTLATLFICLYIPFSFQASIFPAMGLKRIYVWPFSSWRTFQAGQGWNHTLIAKGYTRSGKTVDIDLQSMFEYVGGGHRPSLLVFLDPMLAELGKEIAIKNHFSQFVADKYNQTISNEEAKVEGLDLYMSSWIKNRQDEKSGLLTQLLHRWHR